MGRLLNGLVTKCLVGVGVTMLFSMGASAQIAGTKHDLTSTGTGANRVLTGNPEICVFCHTPHGADSSAPLWNKTLTGSGYTPYASSTLDGVANLSGGVSLACLSCHDGTQAMDTMINAPGSGTQPSNANSSGLGRGYNLATWSGSNLGLMATGIANLTQDLTNDHPIGMPYCGGGMTMSGATATMGGCLDKDFKPPIGNAGAIPATQKAWFDTGPVATINVKDKNDISLYNRAGGAVFYVECGSCHDPHNTANNTFLRIANTGSAVCLACHNK